MPDRPSDPDIRLPWHAGAAIASGRAGAGRVQLHRIGTLARHPWSRASLED